MLLNILNCLYCTEEFFKKSTTARNKILKTVFKNFCCSSEEKPEKSNESSSKLKKSLSCENLFVKRKFKRRTISDLVDYEKNSFKESSFSSENTSTTNSSFTDKSFYEQSSENKETISDTTNHLNI